MKIESIKQGRYDKEKLVIRTECGSYISARLDDAYKLRVGDEISCEKATELETKYNAEKAKKSAAKSLAHHSMSKNDLMKKLQSKGFSEEESEKSADWFEEKGIIDDGAYALSCAEYYVRRGYGRIRIREELRRRGISNELVEETVSELVFSEDEILELIQKKLRGSDAADEGVRRRLVAFLMRRGFKYDEIRAAMNSLQLTTEDMD